MTASDDSLQPTASGDRIADRYRVVRELGRGGMAAVLCVVDENASSTIELGLKQLTLRGEAAPDTLLTRLFQREFQVLQQLSHPRIVQVYDYGVAAGVPYYTMELLDGGDLRERAPLPWGTACAAAFDVCSALALLHSRRLVHRDVSPRNVRMTRSGEAKLIDFGAMAPMGPSAQLVGTPGFMAPEVLHHANLDGRTDLYSLGATLYFALTGKPAYTARNATELLAAFSRKLQPPSQLVSEIPPQLDELVLSLLSSEPSLRPRSAFEVMQRLAATARLDRSEPLSVTQAYLATPTLVGRDQALALFLRSLRRSLRRRGGALLLSGHSGIGRSRMLDECVLQAKTMGARVLHVSAKASEKVALGGICALADQLLLIAPERARREAESSENPLPLSADATIDRKRLASDEGARRVQQATFASWFLRIADVQPYVLAVDDVDRIDAASLAVLGMIAQRARRHRMLLVATSESTTADELPALSVLARRCRILGLDPLDRAQTQELLSSVFGEVDHLMALSARIHALSLGLPRECMALTRHLVDLGHIRYTAGTWTLPDELSDAVLPASTEALFAARVALLRPGTRELGATVALAADAVFDRAELVWLAERLLPAQSAEELVQELTTSEALMGDGHVYTIANAGFCGALLALLPEDQRIRRYATLAELFRRNQRSDVICVKYLLAAQQTDRALELLRIYSQTRREVADFVAGSQMHVLEVGQLVLQALRHAERTGRSAAELTQLRRWVTSFAIGGEVSLYEQTAPLFLERLLHDSGLCYLRESASTAPATLEQVFAALKRASDVYTQTPEHERVYSVEEAIKQLAYFVAVSIAVAARSCDAQLASSLAPLIEPFAALSPLLHAMWQNALAFYESTFARQPERGRVRWREVHQRLLAPECQQLPSVDVIRNAVAFGIGLSEAQLGLPSVLEWASQLDSDPLQCVNAVYLRRLYALHHGDMDAANRFRRDAELLEVQATVPQLFNNAQAVELLIYAAAGDLSAVKQVADRLTALAQRFPNWLPYHHLGEAHSARLGGDLEGALVATARALAACTPDPERPDRPYTAWPGAAGLHSELLLELGRAREAREFARAAAQRCHELEIDFPAHDLFRALGLAETRCGDYATGAAQLEALLERQHALGVSGLHLGMTCEARVRAAIWACDSVAVLRYGVAAAREYRYGSGSALGRRYERLLQEARRASIDVLDTTGHLGAIPSGAQSFDTLYANVRESALGALRALPDPDARAEGALSLLRDAFASGDGYLFLLRESGLQLAATKSSQPVPARLLPFLRDAIQVHARSCITQPSDRTVTEIADAEPLTVWHDGSGIGFDVLILSVGDAANAIGAAVLRIDGRKPRHPLASQVATIVATYLLEAGDAQTAPSG